MHYTKLAEVDTPETAVLFLYTVIGRTQTHKFWSVANAAEFIIGAINIIRKLNDEQVNSIIEVLQRQHGLSK